MSIRRENSKLLITEVEAAKRNIPNAEVFKVVQENEFV